MWGICFDSTVCDGKLFQSVIAYEISADNKTADIAYPIEGVSVSVDEIRPLDDPPRFFEGELVSPGNHPELVGVIRGIGWHFDHQDYMYFITVNGRKKGKRYFSKDLLKR